MENLKNGYSIDAIGNFSIGKKFFVVPEVMVSYASDKNPIVCPVGVFEIPIKEITLYPEYVTRTVIKVVFDTDGLQALEGTEQFAIVTLNKNKEITDRTGVNFSEKEVGANNMFHQASIKAKERMEYATVSLTNEINKCMKTIANNESALTLINNAKETLNW